MATTEGVVTEDLAEVSSVLEAEDSEPMTDRVCDSVIAMYVSLKIIISLGGLVCNTLTIYIFYKERKRYTLFRNIIALAVVDICVLVAFICDSIIGHYVDRETPNFDFMYVFSRTLVEHVRFTNIWMTVCLCYERYRVICKSDTGNDGNVYYIWLRIFLVVVFTFLITLTEYLDIIEYPFLETEIYRIVYEIVIFYLFLLIIPTFLLIFFMYHLQKHVVGAKDSTVQVSNKHRIALTKSLMFIFLIFVVANAVDPVITVNLVFNDQRIDKLDCYSFHTNINDISEVLLVINSSVNFFVYLYFNQQFRKRLKHLGGCKHNIVEDVATAPTHTESL